MNTDKKTPVVLAFSGGLDTSYCVMELNEQGYEVHTLFVDTGGLTSEQVDWIEQRSISLGAHEHRWYGASRGYWVNTRCCAPTVT